MGHMYGIKNVVRGFVKASLDVSILLWSLIIFCRLTHQTPLYRYGNEQAYSNMWWAVEASAKAL